MVFTHFDYVKPVTPTSLKDLLHQLKWVLVRSHLQGQTKAEM